MKIGIPPEKETRNIIGCPLNLSFGRSTFMCDEFASEDAPTGRYHN
jgi:hypothetical protein